jgi:hypothetical protein
MTYQIVLVNEDDIVNSTNKMHRCIFCCPISSCTLSNKRERGLEAGELPTNLSNSKTTSEQLHEVRRLGTLSNNAWHRPIPSRKIMQLPFLCLPKP